MLYKLTIDAFFMKVDRTKKGLKCIILYGLSCPRK